MDVAEDKVIATAFAIIKNKELKKLALKWEPLNLPTNNIFVI